MLYYFAFGLAVVSAIVGHNAEFGSRADLPMKPALLRAVSGLASWAASVLFVFGFWISWFAPFLAFAIAIAFYALWQILLHRVMGAPLFSILTGAVGTILTPFVLFAA